MIGAVDSRPLRGCLPLSRVTPALVFLVLFCGCLAADIREGASRSEVIQLWGEPTGVLRGGRLEVLSYPNGGRVELRDDRVVRVSPPTAPRAGTEAARLPPPFAQIAAADEIPVVQVNWADDARTVDLFSVQVEHGRDRPALHRVRGRGAEQELRRLLASGADVGETDAVGRTPLHRYAEPGPYPADLIRLMKIVVEHGAEVNARDRLGQTPLHIAAAHGYSMVEMLIAAGADPNAADHRGRTPLHVAVEQVNAGARNLLLAQGANHSLADASGFTIADVEREQSRWIARHKTNGQAQKLAYGNHRFVVGGAHFDSILVSVDGAAWRADPVPAPGGLASLMFADGNFFGWVSHRGLHRSGDGIHWRQVDGSDLFSHLEFAASGAGRTVMMGRGSQVMHSLDGDQWSALKGGVLGEVLGLAWLGDRFLAVNRQALAACSPDGLNWGRLKIDLRGLSLKRVRLVNGELFGLGYGGLMIRSPDGITWDQIPIPHRSALNDIAWGNGTYVAVGDRGLILMSEDGRDWRLRKVPDPAGFFAVEFGNHTFVALSRNTVWSFHRQ